jgi:hypothetical protein
VKIGFGNRFSPAFYDIENIAGNKIHDDHGILAVISCVQIYLVDTDISGKLLSGKVDIAHKQLMNVCVRYTESLGNLSAGEVDILKFHKDL